MSRRAEFRESVARLDPADLVFVDESGADTRLVRTYARSPAGRRARGSAPLGGYERLTFVAGLSLGGGMVAPTALDGAMNTERLLAWLDCHLIPALLRQRPGAVVVLDNLRPHHAPAVRARLEAAGLGLLYLPPYSPDFAPIEPAWSKIKQALRSKAARSKDALRTAFDEAAAGVTKGDARGWFTHCGYA